MTDYSEYLNSIKQATDIVDLIRRDVQLYESGEVLKGLSPWSQEKTPSLVVWPKTQTWYDFSGGGAARRGGDAIAYVQEHDGLSFVDALSFLGERAGIPRPDQSDRDCEHLTRQRRVRQLLTDAARHFNRILTDNVRSTWYHDTYGLTDETIDRLCLGMSDGSLRRYWQDAGVTAAEATQTGLLTPSGGEVFAGRLTIPYWRRGEVVYMAARRISDGRAKYLKLPVTEYTPNDTFLGEDSVGSGRDELLITEGVMDCIAAIQAGAACISPCTTRVRRCDERRLLKLIKNKHVVICNDSEVSGAGLIGAMETAEMLYRSGANVHVSELPRDAKTDKLDLCDYLRDGGTIKDVVMSAVAYPEMLIRQLGPGAGDEEIGRVIDQISNRGMIEQGKHLASIKARLGVPMGTLRAMLKERAKRPSETIVDDENGDEKAKGRLRSRKGALCEGEDHYYVRYPDGRETIISTFKIRPLRRLMTDRGEAVHGDLVTESGKVYRGFVFSPVMFRSRDGMVNGLMHAETTWTGSSENVQDLLRLIAKYDIPVHRGVSSIGYHESKWVTPDCVFDADGDIEDSDVAFIGPSALVSTAYRAAPDNDIRDLAAEAVPALLLANIPEATLPLIGWFVSSIVKPRVMELAGHYPLLTVWGTHGSGKTTLISDVFMPLITGKADNTVLSAMQTRFMTLLLMSSTTSVPVFFDEYRDSTKNTYLNEMLRSIYGGEEIHRGKADLSSVAYQLTAPIILGSESRPRDPALADRLISVSLDRNVIHKQSKHVEAFIQLSKLDLGLLAAPLIRFVLKRDTKEDLNRAYGIVDTIRAAGAREEEKLTLRGRDNLAAVVMGLLVFDEWADSLGVHGYADIDYRKAMSGTIEELYEGPDAGRNALDIFIETLSELAANGDLIENVHYVVSGNETLIRLWLCYSVYLKHRVSIRLDDETHGRSALRRLIKENHERGGYVVEVERRVRYARQQSYMVVLDLERGGFDPFPHYPTAEQG